jgi:prepilin-type N-terminal cleavage/methylation domain-containing protein
VLSLPILKPRKGVTLIELLIVVGIIAVATGASLVGYNRFQENQSLRAAAYRLVSDLRLAQQKALAGEKPSGWCTSGTLTGWRVVFTSTTDYNIEGICSDLTTRIDRSGKLPYGATTTSGTSVTFYPLTGGTIAANTLSIPIELATGAGTLSLAVLIYRAGAMMIL